MKVIDETLSDLEKLICEEQEFRQRVKKDFKGTFVDWLHFKARQVPTRPRKVFWSEEVQAQISRYPAIAKISKNLTVGNNVGAWLSSRSQRTDAPFDLLFNEWQIVHFHLGRVFQTPNRIQRTGPLLFAYINGDVALMINVYPHGAWAKVELLEILYRNWPKFMGQFELKGIMGPPPGEERSDNERAYLRNSRVTTHVMIQGKVFIGPGRGISTSKHAIRITQFAQRFMDLRDEVLLQATEDTFPPQLMQEIVNRGIGIPLKIGILFHNGCLSIYEKNRRWSLYTTPPLA